MNMQKINNINTDENKYSLNHGLSVLTDSDIEAVSGGVVPIIVAFGVGIAFGFLLGRVE